VEALSHEGVGAAHCCPPPHPRPAAATGMSNGGHEWRLAAATVAFSVLVYNSGMRLPTPPAMTQTYLLRKCLWLNQSYQAVKV
jgi:hypothetical protein